VETIKRQLEKIASEYGLQIIYAFGSRSKEVLARVEGRIERLTSTPSDLDIGIKPKRFLTIREKVRIAMFFEDLFDVPRVDLVVVPEAPVLLAVEIVSGEILYAEDSTFEAEYQLHILRQAADLFPYERMKQKMIFEERR